jgi:hypothetical protein
MQSMVQMLRFLILRKRSTALDSTNEHPLSQQYAVCDANRGNPQRRENQPFARDPMNFTNSG